MKSFDKALMAYLVRKCFSQFEEDADKELKKSFWQALGVFIRLKIFPRIRQERANKKLAG